jgi:hypothetical protein
MDFTKTLERLNRDEVSFADVVSDILLKTQNAPDRIKMYIDEVDVYLRSEKRKIRFELLVFLGRIFSMKLTYENTKYEDLTDWQINTIKVCDHNGYKSFLDLPKLNKEKYAEALKEGDFYGLLVENRHLGKFIMGMGNLDDGELYFVNNPPDISFFEPYDNELKIIYSLKKSLTEYIEPNKETPPPPSKKQAKGNWGLVARYEFLKEFDIEERIKGLSENDKALVISQILGCNIDNAKKIKNGKYPTNETVEEQLERNQLISKIKQDLMS